MRAAVTQALAGVRWLHDRPHPHLGRLAPPRVAAEERLVDGERVRQAHVESDPRFARPVASLGLVGEDRWGTFGAHVLVIGGVSPNTPPKTQTRNPPLPGRPPPPFP